MSTGMLLCMLLRILLLLAVVVTVTAIQNEGLTKVRWRRQSGSTDPQNCSVGQLRRPLNESDRIDGGRGMYFLPDEVSCNGRLVSLHTCFFYNDEGNSSNTNFRLRVGVFREMGDNYTRDDNWINIDVTRQNSSETQGCASLNLTDPVPVLAGDRIAVRLRNQCQTRCPLLPNLNIPRPTPVFFTRSNADTIPVSQVMATQSHTNVYLDVSASIVALSMLPTTSSLVLSRSVALIHSLQDTPTMTTLPPRIQGTPSYRPTPTQVLPAPSPSLSLSQSVALMYSHQESCTTASPPISLQRTSSYRPTPTPYPQDCSVGQLIWPLNESNKINRGGRGMYFLPDEVSCNGRLVSIHTCFFYNDEGYSSNNNFRLRVGVFRRICDNYTRDDNWINIDVTRQNSSETQGCASLNLPDPVPVLAGDRIAVRLRNQCQMRCPLQPNLNAPRSTSVFFIRSSVDTIPVSQVMATQSYTNVYLDVSASIVYTAVLTSQQTSCPPPTSSPLSTSHTVTGGAIAGIVIAAVIFALLQLIMIGLIVYYKRLHSKNQKFANVVYENNNTSDGDLQAEYHQLERSQSHAQPFDTIRPKDLTYSNNQSNTVSQENERQRFLKRGYSDINSYSVIDGEVETNLSYENPSPHSPNGMAPYSSKYVYAKHYAHANATTSNPPPPGNMSGHYEVDEDYGDPYWHPSSMEDELRMQLMNLKVQEIPREDLQLQEYLGSGQFGTVNRCLWSPSPSSSSPGMEVAVKSLEGESTEEERVKFLQEAAIMGQFKHPNIVKIVGVITTSDPLLIVCELMRKGDLHHYLLSLRPQSGSNLPPEMPAILLSFSRQIAAGMSYLAGKSFVHRDLAARNILVSENNICKIADFGLSRDLQNEDYYVSHGGKIPVKWTAPEALNYRKYSTASDVWSYGVLLYEIWAMGIKPFRDCTNSEALQKVLKGYRLPPPPGCPKQVYELMIKCWHPDPDSRPAFCDLLLLLQRPDFQLLRWSEEDDAPFSKEARTLGGPLEDGEELYTELQTVFSNSGSSVTF